MRVALVLGAALALAGCGGRAATHAPTTTVAAGPPRLQDAVARTLAAGSAHFQQVTGATTGLGAVEAHDNGTISFRSERAHIYRVSPGQQIPEEVVIVGPVIYTNANVQAALQDPSVPPWTRLDTRRLTATERASQADQRAHALAPLFLARGVAHPVLVARVGGRTTYRGLVDPTRLTASPAVLRSISSDYPSRPFRAVFTVDAKGRLRKVVVAYRSSKGTPFRIETSYSSFGERVDLTVPPAREIKDLNPG